MAVYLSVTSTARRCSCLPLAAGGTAISAALVLGASIGRAHSAAATRTARTACTSIRAKWAGATTIGTPVFQCVQFACLRNSTLLTKNTWRQYSQVFFCGFGLKQVRMRASVYHQQDNSSSFCSHIKSQSGSMWHSHCLALLPRSICGRYMGGNLPSSFNNSIACRNLLISRPLLIQRFTSFSKRLVVLSRYAIILP